MNQRSDESDLRLRLKQAEEEAAYYRRVAEETGRRALRRVEQLENLVMQKEQAERQQARLLEQIGHYNEELSHFAHVVSHDLREPLRKITCFGSMLADSLRGTLSGEDAESLDIMIDGAYRMQQMIDALLTYCRVTSRLVESEPTNLHVIIQQLQRFDLAVLLEEKHVVLEIPEPLPTVLGDPVQICELLQNLIANGIKYQSENATPRIMVTATPTDDAMVKVAVRDNGIGIEPARQHNVFGMFKRVHTQGRYEGTGVGLAVCQKIVERHGGQIGLESRPGQGSTFWFTLPAAVPETVGPDA